ncbi:YndM family protein [Tuberibacillus sp. Marseille-P3662]|uniref:YndM family protein n=1 Tax=Tuberibacillus sp. Marseille-P3662 TaxID=1965358 RepID=UPI000A1CEBEB|nr:YndM family protein [Tuberibacillus sp. Marseille-P3662]
METVTVMIIKFVSSVIAFAIGMDLFFDATFVDILSFSLFVTIVSYVIGDRIILPRLGNTTATIADFLLTYTSVWIFGSILLDNYMQIAWGSILSAVLISAVEVFVHHYLLNLMSSHRNNAEHKPFTFDRMPAYETEFAKEHESEDEKEPKK